jgi:palmitoyltransferase
MPIPNPYTFSLSILILFLAYTSQYLFFYIELPPGSLTFRETLIFNILICCVWVCWWRACWVDAGIRLEGGGDGREKKKKGRWCRKCGREKPERAHHCRACGRYVSL